ncbi:MAG: biotin transporter BioY [Ruminococcaceae bacterium]|nr:biotin transporter BioY [Oscillospiraceae bacterium]
MSANKDLQKAAQCHPLRTSDLVQIALCAVLLTVCAWIAIPFPIPFTLQTLALFLILCTLGGRKGLYAVTVYLFLGLAGLPVFSGFQGGIGVLLGASGGYPMGFLAAASIYWLVTAKVGSMLSARAVACLLGLMACYAIATVWFLLVYAPTTTPVTLWAALGSCVLPFLLPDLVKLGLALALSRRLRPYLN